MKGKENKGKQERLKCVDEGKHEKELLDKEEQIYKEEEKEVEKEVEKEYVAVSEWMWR